MDFAAIYKEDHANGCLAAIQCKPTPMVVAGRYYVADGVCGFAWVQFKGNTAWGRWASKNKIAKPKYSGGLQIWISDYNQSMQKKEAYAKAFAETLKAHGIDASYDSRMD